MLTIPEVGTEHDNGTVECVAENEVGKCSCACSLKIIKGIRDDIIVGTVRAYEPEEQNAVGGTKKKNIRFNYVHARSVGFKDDYDRLYSCHRARRKTSE